MRHLFKACQSSTGIPGPVCGGDIPQPHVLLLFASALPEKASDPPKSLDRKVTPL